MSGCANLRIVLNGCNAFLRRTREPATVSYSDCEGMMRTASSSLLPLTSNVLPQAEELIATDTSFVYELWGKSDKPIVQQQCQTFVNRIAGQGAFIVAPVKVLDELLNVVARDELAYRKEERKRILDNDPHAMKKVLEKFGLITEALKAHPSFFGFFGSVDEGLIRDHAMKAMAKYNLEIFDAEQYALAKKEGIRYIATVDGDYRRLSDPDTIVYVPKDKYNAWVNTSGHGGSPRSGNAP